MFNTSKINVLKKLEQYKFQKRFLVAAILDFFKNSNMIQWMALNIV